MTDLRLEALPPRKIKVPTHATGSNTTDTFKRSGGVAPLGPVCDEAPVGERPHQTEGIPSPRDCISARNGLEGAACHPPSRGKRRCQVARGFGPAANDSLGVPCPERCPYRPIPPRGTGSQTAGNHRQTRPAETIALGSETLTGRPSATGSAESTALDSTYRSNRSAMSFHGFVLSTSSGASHPRRA